jgi:O-antigen ligase
MKNSDKIILALGLQNIWQIGLFYPFNIFAIVYFISKIKIKINNNLDKYIIIYFFIGLISLIIFFLSLFLRFDENLTTLIFNALKSFVVFLFLFVYFGVYNLNIKDFFKVVNFVTILISFCICAHYLYLFIFSDFSLYQMRGQILWASGWPQRYVIFCLISFFIFWFKFQASSRFIDLLFSQICFTAILMSGTRSIIFALILTQIITLFISKKNFRNTLALYFILLFLIFYYKIDFIQNYRINEIINFNIEETDSSIGFRINSLLPDVIKSLNSYEYLFGNGHIGIAYLYENEYRQQYQSLESQYLDVFFRTGLLGLFIYMLIICTGIIYTYKILKKNLNFEIEYLLQGSLAWQIAAAFHAITVETVRYPLYALFYFLFIGIISNLRKQIKIHKI